MVGGEEFRCGGGIRLRRMADENVQNFEVKAFQQFMELFVVPELKRRQEAGTLPKPVELTAFQIIWFPDGRERLIRINEEVRAHLVVKLKDGTEPALGTTVFWDDVEQVQGIRLTDDDDADCGHATYIRAGKGWVGQWDAIYNKGTARKHLERGDEFLHVAEHAINNGKLAPCIDNLFSAAELIAKANLLLLFEFRMREKSSHKGVANRLNYQFHLGNIEQDRRDAFNRLAALRYPARYLDAGALAVDETEAQELLTAIKALRDDALRWLKNFEM